MKFKYFYPILFDNKHKHTYFTITIEDITEMFQNANEIN